MGCFWKHNWSKWKIIEEGDRVSDITKGVIGSYIIQKRYCIDCGRTEIEKEKA